MLLCTLCLLSCSTTPVPSRASCSHPAQLVEVATGVYVRPGHAAVVFEADEIANIGFVVGDRCVAVIDSGGSVAEGESLDCAIRRVTDLPVCFVINTHVHPDHLLGNAAFRRSGVEFIGHENLPRSIALRGDTYLATASVYQGRPLPASNIVAPGRAVGGAVELDIGGRVLTVRAHPTAHTDNDVSVIDNQTKTGFVGDLVFLEHLPVSDGSINGWIEELDVLAKESLDYVVPGHGPVPVGWPESATPTLQYLVELRGKVRKWIANGGDLPSAQANIGLSNSSDWLLFDRYHKRNIGAAYAELEWED